MTPDTPPKRIVLATFGSPGDLHPFLAIGAELRARGHEIIVATSALYRDQVSAAGLGFAPVRPDRSPNRRDPDFLDRLIRERATPAAVFRNMFLPSLRESAEDLLGATEGADLVVAHTLASAARLAAEFHGLTWVSAVMQPMGYFLRSYEPPLIGPRAISRVLHRLGPVATRPVLKLARRLTDAWAMEWHSLRAELGLAPVKDHPLWEGQHSAIRSLGLFPRVLGEPQPDWPPQARITGFPFYRPPDQSLDTRLRQFLENGEPPLVFTLGTTAINDPGPFFESATAVTCLGCRAIFFFGHGNQESLEEISPGVIAISYAPHQMVFPFAGAIVHQGGIGTLSEALLAGKPMLIMPYGHDQADNAWRASRLGVARVVSRRRYRAAVVGRELRRLLDDPTARMAAQQVPREVARERGGQRAADLIESALR